MENVEFGNLWDRVMEHGKKLEPARGGIANKLNEDDLKTVVATLDFFQVNNSFLKQTLFDLKVAKYRLFDWIAMLLNGRCQGYGENITEKYWQRALAKKFGEIYLECSKPEDFIQALRERDLQIEFNRE